MEPNLFLDNEGGVDPGTRNNSSSNGFNKNISVLK
jgi:hypothetical protein